MSIGVLHHIPNTQDAMNDCVKKIKIGGYFYTYLYYDLEGTGFINKILLSIVTFLRKTISILPPTLKKVICEIIAALVYMPLVLLARFFQFIGLKKLADKLPLRGYRDQSFFVMRNDALDRFGTSLEQRFSRKQVIEMMTRAGLGEIVISDNLPYWHAIGKRIN